VEGVSSARKGGKRERDVKERRRETYDRTEGVGRSATESTPCDLDLASRVGLVVVGAVDTGFSGQEEVHDELGRPEVREDAVHDQPDHLRIACASSRRARASRAIGELLIDRDHCERPEGGVGRLNSGTGEGDNVD
jgi:hypothetical protein